MKLTSRIYKCYELYDLKIANNQFEKCQMDKLDKNTLWKDPEYIRMVKCQL